MTADIRWQQRFNNYQKAVTQLEKFVVKGRSLNELEEQGLIKAFEYCYELAWNTLKDYLEYQGTQNIAGSRDTFREAFARNLIGNGDAWMNMLQSRNQTTHTYDAKTATEVAQAILGTYWNLFCELNIKLTSLLNR